MDSETEALFTEFVLETGQIFYRGENEQPSLITALPEPCSEGGWFKLHLYKTEFGHIRFDETPTAGIKYISGIENPVIEFIRSTVREEQKEIGRGRLWVEMKYWEERNGEDELVEKPKALDDWYKVLSKWIRKHLPMTTVERPDGEIIKEYMSPAIKKKIEEGYRPTS